MIGPSGLVKAAENTGNFQVVADLNGLKPGTHTINLKTSGLSSEISARTDPEKIKVKISKKGQASFPVQVRYDSNKIAKEYAAGVANSNRQSVKVTGARTDIKKIESVVADVNLSDNVKKSVSRNVLLRAIDENGKQLDVTISPETARVNVPIYLASSHKKVPLRLVSGGQGVDGKKYDFSTDTKYVTLTGTKDALKKIDELKVPVSLAGVDADEDRTISLVSDRSGITAVSPETIQVHIDVKSDAKSSSSSGSSSTSETTSSSDSRYEPSNSSSSDAVSSDKGSSEGSGESGSSSSSSSTSSPE
ncbi:CdaR family protein [Ligilactobacillus acidipiscis]|uniref:CdaR family protein n=1 Tax=Ligilactobacillus acidipiscis TaxID=89059 RepID=UPI00024926FD|nr:CdaR family protein [Ligilactobacillus acidipiscis]